MIKPEIPSNEIQRLEALNEYNILDTLPEEEYDGITRIVSEICGAPISLISLVDPERQWFKSHHGLGATETPRELAFCAHAINKPNETLIVPDASKDERFHDNPLSTGAPDVMFYAGVPLNTPEGFSIGTLCVIDTKPNNLTEGQEETLKILANQVISQLELRKKNQSLQNTNTEVERLNNQLTQFGYRLSHDLKAPLRGIKSVSEWIRDEYGDKFDKQGNDWLDLISDKTNYMNSLIDGMLKYSQATNANIVYEEINLEELVRTIEESIKSNSNFVLNLNNCNSIIYYSPIGITNIIQNLISNSINHGDKDICEVDIELIEHEDNYEIVYQDNGPGIGPEYAEKVFELFETLGAKKAGSTGIGLATVSSIIKRLGGNIQLKNRKDNKSGVCFIVHLDKK